MNFSLVLTGIQFNPIVATASRRPEKALDAPASISVIEPKEITQYVAPSSGDLDLFVTHLRNQSNTLYKFSGKFAFQDGTSQTGLAGSSLPYTGFGTGFFDFDNDGDLDLAVANGRVSRGALLKENNTDFWGAYAEPNLLFENEGDGKFHRPDKTRRNFAAW